MNNIGKVLVIVGMGPQLGMALARRFGQSGYKVGLIARNKDRLADFVAKLTLEGIDAAYYQADVCNRLQLKSAIDSIKCQFGRIDVLEYSPMIDVNNLSSSVNTTPESVMPLMDHVVYGAITAASCVLEDMIKQGDGALLFTSGLSAVVPLPSHTNVSIAMAGLFRYVESLNVSLSDTGVYAGNFVIGELRTADAYAEELWKMSESRESANIVIGDPLPLAAFETLVARGYAQPHPAKLIKPLPVPRTKDERNTFLLALVHAHMNKARFAEDAPAIFKNIESEVILLEGDMSAPYFGAPVNS